MTFGISTYSRSSLHRGALLLVAVASPWLAACAGSAEAGRPSQDLSVTSIVIGASHETTRPPGTTTTATAEPTPTSGSPPSSYLPTDAFRRLQGAGVPDLAARAYLNAALRASEALPNCTMPAEVLAAVGAAESRHGAIGEFDEHGTSKEIIKGYAQVGDDTDEGTLDGEPEKDFAVGPMQFTPATWKDLGRDGNGDGRLDPNNFYDAAMATAAYLCHLAGPFPDGSSIGSQWNQWDRRRSELEQRTKVLREQWERQKREREEIEQFVREHPDSSVDAAVLARLPALPPEPVYREPDRPPGPAQLRLGVERYYGPEGEVRDEYRDNVEKAFRTIIARTGGVKPVESDRLS